MLCCQNFCIIVANYSAFLIAKSSVLLVADYSANVCLVFKSYCWLY
jgi:hypothetical protein